MHGVLAMSHARLSGAELGSRTEAMSTNSLRAGREGGGAGNASLEMSIICGCTILMEVFPSAVPFLGCGG